MKGEVDEDDDDDDDSTVDDTTSPSIFTVASSPLGNLRAPLTLFSRGARGDASLLARVGGPTEAALARILSAEASSRGGGGFAFEPPPPPPSFNLSLIPEEGADAGCAVLLVGVVESIAAVTAVLVEVAVAVVVVDASVEAAEVFRELDAIGGGA